MKPGSLGLAMLVLLAAPNQPAYPQASDPMLTLQGTFREVVRRVLPVAVRIDVGATGRPQLTGQRAVPRHGLGSGIVVHRVEERVYVLTNDHVVAGSTDISVKLVDGRIYKAATVGKVPGKDAAVLSFDTPEQVSIAEMGSSSSMEVGDIVFAVGNPLGFESTVTRGIVSALGRRGPGRGAATQTDYIQTDAAINRGNSGGPLVDINGKVVGMNTWIAAPAGGNAGLGFAIPIDNLKQDIAALIAKSTVQ